MSDYMARLVNCTLNGTEFVTGLKDGRAFNVRYLLRFRISNFDFELIKDSDLPWNLREAQGTCLNTSSLFVRNVAASDVPTIESIVENLCVLLSFACESRVRASSHEYPYGSGFMHGGGVMGTIQSWRPPFVEEKDVKLFLESCYGNFVVLNPTRKLDVVVDYIHHSIMQGLAEEIKIALACIAFENLRDSWARSVGYPWIDGFFREKGATPGRKTKGNAVGIERHLDEMFAAVGMVSPAKRIVDTRNEVLHTGLYGNLQNDEISEFLQTSLREYFLRLVGYKGRFMPYVGGSPTPHVIV